MKQKCSYTSPLWAFRGSRILAVWPSSSERRGNKGTRRTWDFGGFGLWGLRISGLGFRKFEVGFRVEGFDLDPRSPKP